jgi:enduracididine beta-hydroxylase
MHRIKLSLEEVNAIKSLLDEAASQYSSVEDPMFLKNAAIIAHEFPRRVRTFLNDFKQLEYAPSVCVVSGFPIDNVRIGPTPEHWKTKANHGCTKEPEMLFVLLGSLLGDLIGWATQQDGHLIHEVMPIKSEEHEQISTGSEQVIWWHNEDAFHPYRGDYVGLLCLRNPDGIATTFTSMDQVHLKPRDLEVLFESHYVIRPDASHQSTNGEVHYVPENNNHSHLIQTAYDQIKELSENPPKLPILFGSRLAPYIRIDPYFMDKPDDAEAQGALNSLIREVDAALTEIVLQPGDCLFVDNYRAVHGRKSFKARYDGTDRWLKRINITRDLRKSRGARLTCRSRTLF